MKNPYEVLGIKDGASLEEIKAAYKEQVKKYHPDLHQDNPLYELAEEKLREVNRAYETLTGSGGDGIYRQSSGQSSGRSTNQNYYQVRVDIDRGNIIRAEATLSAMSDRDAEWHFLYGMIHMQRGWYDSAISYIQQAVAMDPANMEYKQSLNSILMRAGNFRTTSYEKGYSNQSDQLCRMMQLCCCANLLCGDCC